VSDKAAIWGTGALLAAGFVATMLYLFLLGPQDDHLTVEEYTAALCNNRNLQFEPTTGPTWGVALDVYSDIRSELDRMPPPPDLQEYHDSMVQAVDYMLIIMQNQPQDQMFDPATFSRAAPAAAYEESLADGLDSLTEEHLAIMKQHNCLSG